MICSNVIGKALICTRRPCQILKLDNQRKISRGLVAIIPTKNVECPATDKAPKTAHIILSRTQGSSKAIPENVATGPPNIHNVPKNPNG